MAFFGFALLLDLLSVLFCRTLSFALQPQMRHATMIPLQSLWRFMLLPRRTSLRTVMCSWFRINSATLAPHPSLRKWLATPRISSFSAKCAKNSIRDP